MTGGGAPIKFLSAGGMAAWSSPLLSLRDCPIPTLSSSLSCSDYQLSAMSYELFPFASIRDLRGKNLLRVPKMDSGFRSE